MGWERPRVRAGAEPLPNGRWGAWCALADADGLLVLPAARGDVGVGEPVEFVEFGGLDR
ncbi:hypothetical protein GALL_302900 [mine drainage metagenome]|uniref:MoeA C-terminal domain-containing protein n=1 Tax=mine drainage metagenome TaxID=410659 RepID=A0A1J5QVY5_9ZZZZ